jgi:hypothetical protein
MRELAVTSAGLYNLSVGKIRKISLPTVSWLVADEKAWDWLPGMLSSKLHPLRTTQQHAGSEGRAQEPKGSVWIAGSSSE